MWYGWFWVWRIMVVGGGGLVLWVECLALSLWWAALFDTIAVMAVFWY